VLCFSPAQYFQFNHLISDNDKYSILYNLISTADEGTPKPNLSDAFHEYGAACNFRFKTTSHSDACTVTVTYVTPESPNFLSSQTAAFIFMYTGRILEGCVTEALPGTNSTWLAMTSCNFQRLTASANRNRVAIRRK
jgi:hypothetical protein